MLVRRQRILIGISFLCISGIADSQMAPKALVEHRPEDILRLYSFIGDFSMKEETRQNSKEVFWRYPVRLPRLNFEIDFPDPADKEALIELYPPTPGSGRAFQHMNRGRALFLEGDYEAARKTWLGGRARYGQDYPFHRRNDYFIASSFLMLARQQMFENLQNKDHEEVRSHLVNANTFLSWAYGPKRDLADAIIDERSAWAYYNQAAIYFLYDKWPAAYGAANRGLNFLRATGRSDYRPEFRRILAELLIRNRSYLEAVQELDMALRQDPSVKLGAQVFARVGDIYFDLNNFELAEDMYALANRLDQARQLVRPAQFILRGEALFWLGRFSESQKMMDYGLRSIASSQADGSEPDQDLQALASIRIADAWLALGEHERAKIAYFRHEQEFRSHITATFAKIRLACLELPYYDGHNIHHARQLLHELKAQADILPAPAQEMAWSCEVASYAQHERTTAMVERVRAFAQRYPKAEFLKTLIPAVREVQARAIEQYFSQGDLYSAIDFFEKNRKTLFPEVTASLSRQLFRAYVDIFRSEQAKEFYRPSNYSELPDLALLRQAAMLAEVTAKSQQGPWPARQRKLIQYLEQHKWQIPPGTAARLYLDRVIVSGNARLHLPWVYKLASFWVEKEFSLACNLVYPVLRTMLQEKPGPRLAEYKQIGKDFIKKHLTDLLRFETQCAYSMLELEQELYQNSPSELGSIYLSRSELPVNRSTATLFFAIAEENQKAGNNSIARGLWSHLVQHGSENLPEVQYAKARLDNRRTELEKLWQD